MARMPQLAESINEHRLEGPWGALRWAARDGRDRPEGLVYCIEGVLAHGVCWGDGVCCRAPSLVAGRSWRAAVLKTAGCCRFHLVTTVEELDIPRGCNSVVTNYELCIFCE